VVLTPGVLASSHVVMLAAQPGTHISHLHGDGGNSATLPGENTKDTVKTIAQGRPGDRHHLSSTPCAFFSTRGTSGASRRPAFPAPLLLQRADESSKARAKHAARMRRCAQRQTVVSCPGRSAARPRRCEASSGAAWCAAEPGPMRQWNAQPLWVPALRSSEERCSASGTREQCDMATSSAAADAVPGIATILPPAPTASCESEAPPRDAIKSCRRATANARDFARRTLTIQRLLPFCGLPHWMRFCRK
jgi:hypothetical protein